MSLAILGLGTALPANAITQDRACEVARRLCCHTEDQSEVLPGLYRQSGIERRHLAVAADATDDIVAGTRHSQSIFLPSGQEEDFGPSTAARMEFYRREALTLALSAARQALDRSGLPPGAISHVVTVSCTGFSAPGVDYGLITQLGLAPTVQRTHVGFMGCHGAVNGLRVAQAYADAAPLTPTPLPPGGEGRVRGAARVLLCAVELCSVHFHYQWDPKKLVANALFADGAAAVVGAPGGAAPGDTWKVAATGSCLFPNTAYAMKWDIGDHGFEMHLSTRIPNLIAGALKPWLEQWLAENGVALADVGSWAVHPGGPRVLNVVEECLGLGRGALDTSREVLARCGNMSSPTVLFVLDRLRQTGAPRPCVVLGFGPGLVAEAALIR
jgi:predicted naringenin-chalcone synthase